MSLLLDTNNSTSSLTRYPRELGFIHSTSPVSVEFSFPSFISTPSESSRLNVERLHLREDQRQDWDGFVKQIVGLCDQVVENSDDMISFGAQDRELDLSSKTGAEKIYYSEDSLVKLYFLESQGVTITITKDKLTQGLSATVTPRPNNRLSQDMTKARQQLLGSLRALAY